MKHKLLFFLVVSVLFFGCKKEKSDVNSNGQWNLKSYSVTYYNQAGDKIFESKPDELLQFSKVEINGDSINFPIAPQTASARSPIKTNPAQLIFLNVKKSLNTISVNFGTANEVNVDHFIIERSGNGGDFIPKATIEAVNTNSSQDYSYTDASPLFGNNYYRLKLVDNDGSFSYSGIVLVSMNFSLSRVNGNINLPVDLVDHTFKQVALRFSGSNKMVWSDETGNPQYLENGITKTAASAKLNMEFTK